MALTDRERQRLIEIGVEAARGRVPVIAGTGHYSTAETIRLTKHAEHAGASGAIVILPYYMRPSVDEICDHYRRLRSAVTIPIMLYNNPANSAAPALPVPTVAQLYQEGTLAAIKSTVPTVHEIHELRATLDEGFRVFYGSFMAPLEGFAGGAHGWISGILNVVTAAGVRLWRAAVQDGDIQHARKIFIDEILPIQQIYMRQHIGPISDLVLYRAILELRGLKGGASRLPLRPATREQLSRLNDLLQKGALGND